MNCFQKAATHAGYIVAYNIAKSNKALSDGEFINLLKPTGYVMHQQV